MLIAPWLDSTQEAEWLVCESKRQSATTAIALTKCLPIIDPLAILIVQDLTPTALTPTAKKTTPSIILDANIYRMLKRFKSPAAGEGYGGAKNKT